MWQQSLPDFIFLSRGNGIPEKRNAHKSIHFNLV